MICEDVRAAMGAGEICEETEMGAKVATHCLYPSFEIVSVYVSKLGDGYRVTDAGGAVRNAWVHGRDAALTGRFLTREAARHSLKVSHNSLVADAPSIDWLRAAILAVANASAAVAHASLGKAAAASEKALKDRIRTELEHIAPEEAIGSDVEVIGSSGDVRHFDYSVVANDNVLFVSAVAPHHSSIYAKYVAFSDTRELGPHFSRLAVFDRPLARGDVALMLQVATELVPIRALDVKARHALSHVTYG